MNASFRFVKIALFVVLIEFVAAYRLSGHEDITIDRGGILLTGRFFVAEGRGKFPTVVLLNGFPGGGNDVLGIGKLLAEAGINVLTFSYSGTGKSQGLTSFDNQQKDIQAAFDFIRQSDNISRFQIDTSLIYLGGWCHGGGMALAYSVNHPEIISVFSIVGNDFGEFMREYIRNPEMNKMVDNMFDDFIAKEYARFEKGALPREMAEAGIENMNPIYDIRQNTKILAQKDILLICGWNDNLVTVEQYMLPLYRALKKEDARNLQIFALQDGHNFTNTRKDLAGYIANWIMAAPERKQ